MTESTYSQSKESVDGEKMPLGFLHCSPTESFSLSVWTLSRGVFTVVYRCTSLLSQCTLFPLEAYFSPLGARRDRRNVSFQTFWNPTHRGLKVNPSTY